MNKLAITLALFTVLAGLVVCPFMPYHTAENNPFHSYVFPVIKNQQHVQSLEVPHQQEKQLLLTKTDRDDPASGNEHGTVSIHSNNLISSAVIVFLSGNAITIQTELSPFQPGGFLLVYEPLPIYPQEFISPPDKPPPFLFT